MKQGYKVASLILLVLLIDQTSKFYIKTHFAMNEQLKIFGLDWARLLFVENEGMAFGLKFDFMCGDFDCGKLILSLFRVLMVTGLVWYLRALLRAKAPMGFISCIGLITAGALGNIIDSAFYALIFSGDYHGVARLTPFGQGYGLMEGMPMNGFLHGRVVDMFYFPITTFNLPEWMGGGSFTFFSPIFNVADAVITTGLILILLFQRRFFRDGFIEEQKQTPAAADEPTAGETSPEAVSGESGGISAETTETAQHTALQENAMSDSPAGQPAENQPEGQAERPETT